MNALNPVRTVGDQIAEALVRHGMAGNKKAAAPRSANCWTWWASAPTRKDQYPHQYSGGMRQRAMIAMALACNPQVVIADEPTTALDVMIQAQILELLDDLRRQLGLAVILVTHDLGVVAEVCDTVLVMYGGVTAEYADVDTIFNDPQHPYTQRLLDAFPDLTKPDERWRPSPAIRRGWMRCRPAAALPRAARLPLSAAMSRRRHCSDLVRFTGPVAICSNPSPAHERHPILQVQACASCFRSSKPRSAGPHSASSMPWTASASTWAAARCWRWWARAAAASPPWR